VPETERLLNQFTEISIIEARVDSKLPDGITLCFCLSPTPVPIQWKSMFTNLSNDKGGSVMSTTNPMLHGNDIIWKVIEGDIPNAKHYVAERIAQANALFEQMVTDNANERARRDVETTDAELDRLQDILDES
jgi:hypothetical protein